MRVRRQSRLDFTVAERFNRSFSEARIICILVPSQRRKQAESVLDLARLLNLRFVIDGELTRILVLRT